MDLSVIICTYNRAHSLALTLDAVSLQVVPTEIKWELIVVDNNSSDHTPSVVESYRSKIAAPIIYIFEKSQGKSIALNSAIKKANGRILVFTDDDVSPEADWLKKIVESMQLHNADGVGGKILLRWLSAPPRWLLDEEHLCGRLAMVDFDYFSKLEPGAKKGRIYGANMAFKRELFAELGEFDTGLGPIGKKLYRHEETDFVSRAVSKGKTLVYDPSIVVWHNIGRERMRKKYFRKWYFDDGENLGLRFRGGAPGRKILGIPFFALWAACCSFSEWFFCLFNRRSNRFLAELEIWKNFGFCCGCLRNFSR